jgi:HK97 family phage prohead protease
MPDTVEVRMTSEAWPDEDFSLRSEGREFTGYAAVFNMDSQPLPFIERVAPGSFRKTIKESKDIRAFGNHNPDLLLGSSAARTLRLSEDERGLLTNIDLPETSYASDLSVLIARGDVRGMSFGFRVVKEKWGEPGALWEPSPGTEALPQRMVTEVRLYEVSIVTGFPAYPDTTASVRHLADALGLDEPDELVDAFRVLRDPEGTLTCDQRDLLLRAINARTEAGLVGPDLAAWRTRFAVKAG